MSKIEETPKHSGFEAPAIGSIIPKDYVMIKHKDGRISFEPPQNTDVQNEKTKNCIRNNGNNEENDSAIQ